MKAFTQIIIGVIIGLFIGSIIHNLIINNVKPERGYMLLKPDMIYEDGSYKGCLPERNCSR